MALPGQDPSAQGAPADDAAPEGKGGVSFQEMVTRVSDYLSTMQDVLPSEGVPQELVAKLGQINDDYKATLQQILQAMGQGGDKPAGAPRGVVDANAGSTGVPLR